jgi:hypothetical protein
MEKSAGAKALLFYLAIILFFPANVCAWRIGTIDILMTGSVRETYDDNITYAQSDPKDDFITSVILGIGAHYEEKTRNFKLSGDISRNFFADNSNFNNTSEDIRFDFGQEFSKYDRISLQDTFSHATEPRSFEDALGRTSGRYSTYSNRFNAAYTRELTRQLSVITRYAHETNQYSRKDLKHSALDSIGLETDYAFSSMTIALLSYDFAKRQFERGAHAYTQTVTGGLRQYLTSRLYLDAKAGMNFIRSYNDTRFSRPLFSASLTNDIDENTSANIALKKEYYTRSYESDIFNYWESSGMLTRRLLERLGVSLSGFYGQGEYISFKIKDKVKGAAISLPYDVVKDAKLTLGYSYSHTTSNVTSREYKKNTVSLGLTMDF